ncbi:MAG TPA: hypothetical protein VK447_00005, partial [Myxococcaceae bacterium]|nr:hypothetical protein [Myxococcaceae bacterium]
MPVRPHVFAFISFVGAFASGCSCGSPPIEIIDCAQLSPEQRDPSCGPRALAIVDAPRTLPAGACVALPLQTWDATGQPSPVNAETVIDLRASTGAGSAFSLTPDCATPVTAVALASGGSGLTVYFRSTIAG